MEKSILFLLSCLFSLASKSQANCNECKCLSNKSYTWKIVSSEKNQFLVRGDSLFLIKEKTKKIIEVLNKENKVKIKFLKEKENTIFVKIINSTFFTQSMGDAGANWYLASLVFSLTESNKYKNVYVNFQSGDHGGLPGLKSRKEFESLYKICK